MQGALTTHTSTCACKHTHTHTHCYPPVQGPLRVLALEAHAVGQGQQEFGIVGPRSHGQRQQVLRLLCGFRRANI